MEKEVNKSKTEVKEKTDPKDKQAEAKQISSLKNLIVKKGDYSIHILIEDLIHLASVKDE